MELVDNRLMGRISNPETYQSIYRSILYNIRDHSTLWGKGGAFE